MDPITAMMAAAAIQGGASYISGKKAQKSQRRAQKPYIRFQERKNQLIDELLAGVSGRGKYADFFRTDEAAFQKSFVDPAKKMFESQIAPSIQQQSIAGGMQYGTGVEDRLARAGVDLDEMLNRSYMDYMQQAENRKSSTLASILGTQPPQVLDRIVDPLEGLFGSIASMAGKFMGSFGGAPSSPAQSSPTQSLGFSGTEAQRNMLNPNYENAQDASLFGQRKGFDPYLT